MYYSSGNYEAFARPKKPEGVDNKSAYGVQFHYGVQVTNVEFDCSDPKHKLAKRIDIIENGEKGGIDLTENERVKFIQKDAVAELQRMKEDGDGTVVAYGEEIGTLLLDNGLVDEITVTTVPILVGGDEKALKCGLSDGGTWIVRSNKMLVDGKMRTVYGKV